MEYKYYSAKFMYAFYMHQPVTRSMSPLKPRSPASGKESPKPKWDVGSSGLKWDVATSGARRQTRFATAQARGCIDIDH